MFSCSYWLQETSMRNSAASPVLVHLQDGLHASPVLVHLQEALHEVSATLQARSEWRGVAEPAFRVGTDSVRSSLTVEEVQAARWLLTEISTALDQSVAEVSSTTIVASKAETTTITVHLRMAQPLRTVDALVDKGSQVSDAVRCALNIPAMARIQQILLGSESIAEGSFAEHGVQEGATIDVEVEVSFGQVVADIVALNPHIKDREKLSDILTKGASLHRDGTLQDWHLLDCKLRHLPDSFGRLAVDGDLNLGSNSIESLPESFGSIVVGGNLYLGDNLLTSLPDSFVSVRVGGDLGLDNNLLSSLPEGFGRIAVGGSLDLHGNSTLNEQAFPAALNVRW